MKTTKLLITLIIIVLLSTVTNAQTAGGMALTDITASPVIFSANTGTTSIGYTLAGVTHAQVLLNIYDPGTNLVRTVDGGVQGSGPHSIIWDGKDSSASTVPDGQYVANVSATVSGLYSLSYKLKLAWGDLGTGNGQLNEAYRVAINHSGYVFVVDTKNERVQVFDQSGTYLSQFGSAGTGDGQFTDPYDIAFDASDNMYVADTFNHRIQKFDSAGTYVSQWGTNGAGNGQFYSPYGIAIDMNGNVYVADTYNNRIQKFDLSGNYVTQWGSLGTGNGQFDSPYGITVDTAGYVYVVDTQNNRMQKFDSNGGFIMQWGNSLPFDDWSDGELYYPYSAVVDSAGNIYVADSFNYRIQKFAPDGSYMTQWGQAGFDDDTFNFPFGIALDSSGNVYVTDVFAAAFDSTTRVKVFSPEPTTVYGETTVTVDSTAPVTTGVASGTPGNNGWYVSDVLVTLSAADNPGGSGVQKTEYSLDSVTWNPYPAGGISLTADGQYVVSFRSTDIAGNVETPARSLNVNIDRAPPVITSGRTPANANGWNNGPVTVTFSGNDALSGIASVSSPVILSGEGAGQSVTGTATDNAGNTASLTVSDINIDLTPPTITGAPTSAPGSTGWYTHSVTVHFTAGDALSGIDIVTPDAVLASDGKGQSVTGTATDKAGNSASFTVSGLDIDMTPPAMTASRTPANANGWNNDSVTVTFAGTDATSGLASISDPVTLKGEGAGQSVTGTVTDNAGNTASLTVSDINIDLTRPSINGAPTTAANKNGWYTGPVTVHFTATDTLSGIDTVTPDTVLASDGKGQSVTGTATDKAGNSASATVAKINIDGTAPVTSCDISGTQGNAGWYTSNVRVNLKANDAVSGVQSVQYRLDGGKWTNYKNAISIGAGTHTLSYKAIDNAGNVENVKTQAINVDTVKPWITDMKPASNAGNVLVNAMIAVRFSEEIKESSLNSNTFIVKDPNGKIVAGTIAYAGRLGMFTPSAPLDYSKKYTVTLTKDLEDIAGNHMASPYSWKFTTEAPPRGMLKGYVFVDANRNGNMERNEAGLANTGIWLTNVMTAKCQYIATDKNGYYQFTGLPNGVYLIVENVPSGYKATTPYASYMVISGTTVTRNFGIIKR